MKKIFGILILMGIMLALVTAGSVDSDTIETGRMIVQAAVSSLMVLCGTHFVRRGEAA